LAGAQTHGRDAEQEALLADSVGVALLVILETLTPAERIAFVLHDLFDLPFDEIVPSWDAHHRGPSAREPGPPASAGNSRRSRRRPRPPPSGGRGVPGRLAWR
jgi:RNA polymerase sigma-70 factor (ECF subfamily)